MRPSIDVADIRRDAVKTAGLYLQDAGTAAFPSSECPFDLNQLIDEDFDDDAIRTIIAASAALDRARPRG